MKHLGSHPGPTVVPLAAQGRVSRPTQGHSAHSSASLLGYCPHCGMEGGLIPAPGLAPRGLLQHSRQALCSTLSGSVNKRSPPRRVWSTVLSSQALSHPPPVLRKLPVWGAHGRSWEQKGVRRRLWVGLSVDKQSLPFLPPRLPLGDRWGLLVSHRNKLISRRGTSMDASPGGRAAEQRLQNSGSLPRAAPGGPKAAGLNRGGL